MVGGKHATGRVEEANSVPYRVVTVKSASRLDVINRAGKGGLRAMLESPGLPMEKAGLDNGVRHRSLL